MIVLIEKGAVVDCQWKDGPLLIRVSGSSFESIELLPTKDPKSDPLKAEKPDFVAQYAIPGFVDIHNHGIGGAEDILLSWTSPEYSLSRFPKYGVTSVLASLIPTDTDLLKQCIAALNPIIQSPVHGAVCEGYHFEGPVIQDLGALPNGDTDPSDASFQDIVDIAQGHLKIMTISPSLEAKASYSRLRILLDTRVRASLGHDKTCSFEDILGAVKVAAAHKDAPRLHITHIFNVSSFHHRLPSLVNFGLASSLPRSWAAEGDEKPTHTLELASPTVEVIADGIHVHDLTILGLLSARKADHVAIITDNILHSEPNLCAKYCDRMVQVSADGRGVYLKGTETLAGSSLSLWAAFSHLVNELNVPLTAAANMLSHTPATIANISHRVGAISQGLTANFLLFDSDYNLQATIIHGKCVFAS